MLTVATPRLSRRRLKWLVLGAVIVVCLWLLASYLVAYRLTRRPHARFAETVPAISWAKIKAFRLPTSDGEDLGAWLLGVGPERPVVLLLHGNGGCRRNCLRPAEMLGGAGYSSLLLSLRAHGDSTGEVNDFGYSARKDVAAAVAWLEKNCRRRPIVVWGRSLGSAAAIFAAPELNDRVAGYILECPYQDLRTACRNRTDLYLPPGLSEVAYTGLSVVCPLVLPDVDDISPLDAAAGIPPTVPVLVLAGDADRRARPEEAQAIYQRISSHARLVIVPGGDHVHLDEPDPEHYRRVVLDWLGSAIPELPRRPGL
jgi:alpha-beta hydrolase superfamily lysophospholipase